MIRYTMWRLRDWFMCAYCVKVRDRATVVSETLIHSLLAVELAILKENMQL